MKVRFSFWRASSQSYLTTYSMCSIGFVKALQRGEYNFDVCQIAGGFELYGWHTLNHPDEEIE